MTTLHGPRVTLADLFDDAGPDSARVRGPGPAPGGRIVVEAPRLAAIARQFGVDWTPASKSDRAVLDWPGRPLPRPALVRRGADVMMELDSPGIWLTAPGQALDSGAVGERIRVPNPISRAVIEADVIAPDRVRLAPGATPLMTTARANRAAGEVVVR